MKSATRRPLPPAFADLPKDYRVLCSQILLPRPLRTRAEYREAMAVAEAMAGHDLTRDQNDYLDAIGTFLGEWEAHEKRLPAVAPHELLAFLLAENSLRGSDLARILGVTRSLASRSLAGKRRLTTAHIRRPQRPVQTPSRRVPARLPEAAAGGGAPRDGAPRETIASQACS